MNNWVILMGVLIFLGSCTVKKITHTVFSPPPKNAEELIERVNSKVKNVEWINLKGSVNIIQKDREFDLSINIKNRKDSLIWVSTRGPFGIEIMRMQITPDSIYYINRMNKTYFINSVSQINELINLTFYDLQDIIIANPKILGNNYTFESDKNDFYLLEDDSLRYWITGDYQIQKSKIMHNKKNIELTFDNYNKKDSFPRKINIKSSSEHFLETIITYSNVELNTSQKTLFIIPNTYNEAK